MAKDAIAEAGKPKADTDRDGGGLLTPSECAVATGNVMTGPKPYQRKSFSADHMAAATLHGWNDHAHHAGEPFKMKLADYQKALEAPGVVYDDGKCRPHAAARSKFCPHPKLKAGKKVEPKES